MKEKDVNFQSPSLEVISPVGEGRKFRIALFDFDGTLSLIREGWQEVMIPYFCEEFITSLPNHTESEDEIIALVTDFVDNLTGKQTIFQCMQLKIEIEKRGGCAKEAMDYKNEYLRRLFIRIEGRRNALADKSISSEALLVRGSISFLEALKKQGVEIFCASGTDEPQVIEEAKLLGLDKYFGNNIFGARDEHAQQCSKELVIKRLLSENNVKGEELLSFGDGFVEIELVKNVGGYAVAVATDEKEQKGINPLKREKLLAAGAHAVIPDFHNTEEIINHLFNN
ncbi:MAG: HAD family hydrolase [Ruminococcaceae bacterium]|nr:HAD family hydrolase [Oscillospiraceae bacterium]